MYNYKKWVFTTLSSTALILFMLSIVNYVIDPYGVYYFSVKGYNRYKHVDSDPYLFKTYQIKKQQPEAIILGTSRAMRLPPPYVKAITDESSFNVGLSAATPYINLRYLEYALRVDRNLKTVILGLDFEVFENDYPLHANFNEERLNSLFYMQDYFATLLSEKALKDSYHVITENLSHKTVFTENRYLSDGSFDENFVYSPNINIATLNAMPTQFELSDKKMKVIQEIKQLCEQKNIELYIYISPVHAIILETFWQNNLWIQYEDWKRKLVNIAPIWDFSGYNQISMSSLNSEEYYNDLSHFSKKVGQLMLDRMLGHKIDGEPYFFGTYVTSANIETHLKKVRLSRTQWQERDKSMSDILSDY